MSVLNSALLMTPIRHVSPPKVLQDSSIKCNRLLITVERLGGAALIVLVCMGVPYALVNDGRVLCRLRRGKVGRTCAVGLLRLQPSS